MSNVLVQIRFNIDNTLIKTNLYIYVVWLVHALWLVQPAVCDSSGHWGR